MESRVGLDYIVENAEYAGKLAAALASPAPPVKKQVGLSMVFWGGGTETGVYGVSLHE